MLSHDQLLTCEGEMIDFFGYESLYIQLSKCLDDATLEDALAYIARMNDFDTTYKMEEVC